MCIEYKKTKTIKEKPFNIREFVFKLNERNYGYAAPFINELSLSNFLSRSNKTDEFYILEATYEHDQDIEYIYQKIKPFVKDFVANFKTYLNEHNKNKKIIFDVFDSNELPSDLAKQANNKNRVSISMGVYGDHSFYDDKKKLIHINFFPGSELLSLGQEVIDEFIVEQVKDIVFKELKLSIAHELAHWLDDSLTGAVSKYIGYLNKKHDQTNSKKAQWD